MTAGTFSSYVIPLEHDPSRGYAILLKDLVYCDLAGRKHRAHAGMPTDGLTIPRFFWRLVGPPFRHQFLLAAIIHDHYCYKAASLDVGRIRNNLRLHGDQLFEEMCSQLGAGDTHAKVLYGAVRIGAYSTRKDEPIPDYIHAPQEFRLYINSQYSARELHKAA